jgi:hypothetical protein
MKKRLGSISIEKDDTIPSQNRVLLLYCLAALTLSIQFMTCAPIAVIVLALTDIARESLQVRRRHYRTCDYSAHVYVPFVDLSRYCYYRETWRWVLNKTRGLINDHGVTYALLGHLLPILLGDLGINCNGHWKALHN